MTTELEIKHDINNGGGRYWVEVEGGSAKLTYKIRSEDVIIIDHTYVPPQARGRSIARKLVEHAVDEARARGQKIVPQCPYVARLFDRRPDLNELRAA